MLEQLRSYLKPPVFSGDDAKTFTASLLHVILWSLLVGIFSYTLIATFLFIIQPPMLLTAWLYVLALGGLTLVLMVVMRRGYVQPAAIAINLGLWLIMTVAAYSHGGVVAPAYSGYLIVIICTCLLVSWQWGLVAAAASALAGAVFLLAADSLPEWWFTYSNGAVWSANVAYFFVATMLLALALRAIKRAAQQTRDAVLERQKTEQALSHSEQRFHAIFDAVNDAIIVQDIDDGRILDVNQKMCEMYGYTREEARQLIVGDLSAGQVPYTQQEALAWLKKAASGGPQIFEWQAKDRAGRLFWTEVNMRRAAIDGQDRLLVVVRDVDERKRAEQHLHLKEESLRLALEAARMSTWDWHATTDQWSWSDNIGEVFGWQAIEPVGTFASFLNQVVEEDRQRVSDVVAQALTGQGDRFMLEHRVRWPDGSIHWLEDRGQVFRDVHGQPVRVTGTIAEISDRKRMEAELAHERDLLQALMDNFPDTIYFKDTASRFTRINRAQATMLGVATPEEAIGKTDADFFSNSELAQSFLAEEQRLMTTGEPIIDRLEYNSTPEGQPRWLTATKVPLHDASGQIVGMVGISRNITDRVLAEQREKTIGQGLRAVIEATQELIDCADPDILYRRSVELAREKLGLERCGLHLLSEDQQYLLGTYGTDDQGRTTDERQERVEVAERREVFTVPDRWWTLLDKPFTYWEAGATHTLPKTGWIAATPIRRRQQNIGMLYNDTAVTHAPLNPTLQEITAVYCSLLGSLIELKRTETQLAHERDLLQSLMDNIPDSIYFKDTASRFTHINQAMARILGLREPREAQGKTDADFFPVTLDQMYLEEEQQLLHTGQPLLDRVEFNPTLDGQPRWFSASKVPLRNATGQVVGLVGISRDITDRRLMEESLRESQARFGSAFEHAAVGMALVASDRSIMQVNQAFCQILGYEPAEVVGQPFGRLTHPDDVAISAEYHRRLFAGEIETYQFEKRYLHRQGQTVWAWLTVSVVRDAENRPQYAIAQIQDITERKQAEEASRASEERYRRLVEVSPVAMWINQDGIITYMNPAALRILGATDLQQVVGRAVLDFIHPDYHMIVQERILQMVDRERVVPLLEEKYVRLDGSVVDVEVTATPFATVDGRAMQVLFQDITERKQAEAQIERALRETRVRFEVSQALAGKETEDEVLDALIRHAGLYPQAFVAIFTFDRRGDEFVATLRRQNPYESGLTTAMPIGVDMSASQYTLVDRFSADRIFVSADVRVDERFEPAGREVLERTGAVSFAAIPLMVGNEWLGYIAAMAQPSGYFDEEKQHLYQTLAEQGAVALRAARLQGTIRESQQRLSLLVQESPLAVVEWNTDWQVVSWNPAAERIFGYPRAEALGRHAAGFIFPEGPQPLFSQDRQAMLTQASGVHGTYDHVTKDGRRITCEWFHAPLVGADGQAIGVASLVQDITERKQAEERERRTSQGLRAVIEAVDELMSCADLETLFRRAVELAREKLKVERCGLFTLDEQGWLRGTYGTDMQRQTTDEREAHFQPINVTGLNGESDLLWTITESEHSFWEGDQHRVSGAGWVGATFIRTHDRVVGVLYNDAAITHARADEAQQEVLAVYCSLLGSLIELKRAEAALRESESTTRALLDAIPDAIFRFDPQGVFKDFIPAKNFAMLLPLVEFVGKPYAQVLPPDLAQQLNEHFQIVLETGEPRLYEYALASDGPGRFYEARLVKMAQGDVLSIVRDVTDRKQAELALQQREAYLRAILDNFPYWFWLKDTEGRYLAANRTLAQALGFNQVEELIGKTDWDVTPTVAAGFRADDQVVIDNRRPQFVEEIVIDHGEEKWFETFKSPIFDAQDNVIGTAGFSHDITARRQAEAAIRESEALFRQLADNAPAFIAMNDEHGTVTYLNRAWLEFRGSDLALPLEEWSERIHPDDRRRYTHEFRSAQQGQRKFTTEYRLRRADGQYRWLLDTVVPRYAADERFAGFIGIAIDITDRKNAEEALRRSEGRLRLITDNMADSVSQVDAQQRLVYASPSAEREYGHSLRSLLGRSLYDLVHPEDSSRLYHQVVMAIELRLPSLRLEYRYRHAAGHYLWVESEMRLLYNERGDFTSAVLGSRDISARKQIEAERENLIKELEDKNAELERFTYTVSHDLKSPLITIRGFLGFLEKDAAAGNLDRLRADIVRIVEATTRMQRLLDELLELSRIGRMSNPPEEVALGQIAREAVEVVHGRIVERGVQVEIADDLPTVNVDRTRLVEAMQNLVDNAVKFMGDQPEPRIVIGALGTERAGLPIFFVADNGLGIEPEYHERIFGLFNKLDAKSEGTGVGLALVKRIIDLHGGHIWVESDGPGQGSTFFFTLPRPASAARNS